MPGHRWPDEDKARAIALVAEHGLAHAWRETGIPKPTIVSWCKEAGVERFRPEQTRAAVEVLVARAEQTRETLRLMLLEKAVDLLERMDEPHTDFKGKDGGTVVYPIAPATAVQNYATSAAILIDKFRLEMGEATGRQENVNVEDGLPADAKQALRDRYAQYARDAAERRADRSDDQADAVEGVGTEGSTAT